MVLYTSAFILFFQLLYRIAKTPSLRQRIGYSLVMLLYMNLFFVVIFWTYAPLWMQIFTLSLFVAGTFHCLLVDLTPALKEKQAYNKALSQLKKDSGPFYAILETCQMLSEARLGALIFIERRKRLDPWHAKGIRVDACISKEILYSIFTPPGSLHDGACLIQRNRISAAAVIVPLTQNPEVSKDLGTRHRAALGMSEATDALGLIVSEETGAISIADRGRLHYDVSLASLPEDLERCLRFKHPKTPKSKTTRAGRLAPLGL